MAFLRTGAPIPRRYKILHFWPAISILFLAQIFVIAHAQPGTPSIVNLDGPLNDAHMHQIAGPGVHVLVLIFAASDCPISNRYIPEIARLTQEFTGQGVRFRWVYPNPGDTAVVVAQHNRDYSISAKAILDHGQALVQLAHATVTPEAAVFEVNGGQLREVYRGRIDDRYLNLGLERPIAEHHDLEAAIAATLADKPVPQPGGPPVGCSIVFLQK
jgi:hypothetical protein